MSYELIIDHIPKNTPYNRRPQNKMTPRYITIHNTGNPNSNAKGERGWLTNPSNKRGASYHYAVDENYAVECLPLNENGWHAGDGNGNGNMRSIGIEICESGNYEQTFQNAIELTAKLMKQFNIPIENVKRHHDFSSYGKICPRLMYDNGTWDTWYKFKKLVEVELMTEEEIIMKLQQWQIDVAQKSIESLGNKMATDGKNKIINDVDAWKKKVEETPEDIINEFPWLIFVLLDRLAK